MKGSIAIPALIAGLGIASGAAAQDPVATNPKIYHVMIDNPTPGSGQVFDWSLASDVSGAVRLLLAGGLNADNVADAIATVHPWGVDVCTGVEAEPGRKDPRKVRAFISGLDANEDVCAEVFYLEPKT